MKGLERGLPKMVSVLGITLKTLFTGSTQPLIADDTALIAASRLAAVWLIVRGPELPPAPFPLVVTMVGIAFPPLLVPVPLPVGACCSGNEGSQS